MSRPRILRAKRGAWGSADVGGDLYGKSFQGNESFFSVESKGKIIYFHCASGTEVGACLTGSQGPADHFIERWRQSRHLGAWMAQVIVNDLVVSEGDVPTYVVNADNEIVAALLTASYDALVEGVFYEPSVIKGGQIRNGDAARPPLAGRGRGVIHGRFRISIMSRFWRAQSGA